MKPLSQISLATLSLAALCLTGCGTCDFIAYRGQQEDWPVSPGTLAKTYNGITIFHGLPDVPYEIIGQITCKDAGDNQLCWFAKAHQADAVIITARNLTTGGAMTIPGAQTTYAYGNAYHTTAMPSFAVPITHTTATAYLAKLRPASSTN